jgi:glucose/arabinose dehydrogenase
MFRSLARPAHSSNVTRLTVVFATALTVVAACGDWPAQTTNGFRQLRLDLVADGLDNPVLVGAPAGDRRLFVLERTGTVRVIENGTLRAQPFLDLTSEVSTFGAERGALGLAFHPQYSANGRFFVSYTANDGTIRVDEFRTPTPAGNTAEPNPYRRLFSIVTPGVQHFGGMLQFTPEGLLMISFGEGGLYSEPGGAAQDPTNLLGKLVRIDVDRGEPYGIPDDNPFVTRPDWRPEVWAVGLRNPWRFAIDRVTRSLFVADVGDNSYEEINVVPLDTAGLNYGWSIREGPQCLYSADLCASADFHEPELSYTHLPPCTSVTGGMVYRGTQYPEHQGRYFYSDYCLGWIRSFKYVGGALTESIDWAATQPADRIASFGEDGFGELFAVSLRGRIYRIGPETR